MVWGFRKRAAGPVVTDGSLPSDEINTGHASGVDSAVEAGVSQLEKFKIGHQWDYNLDAEEIQAVNKAVDSGDVEKEANFEHALLEEDSPYFEVRAAVRNYDE
jgi:hypothetical protein